jgi:hypothetical protein
VQAAVFHGIGDIRLDDVPEPELREANDAIVRITASAICGTDLHFVRGSVPGVEPGTILGHEGVGIVEQVGRGVRNLLPGATASSSRPRSPADTARTAAPRTSPSATTPTRTGPPPAPRSSAARSRRAASTRCRPKRRGSPFANAMANTRPAPISLAEAMANWPTDTHADRLEVARRQGAEVIDYNVEEPVQALKELTGARLSTPASPAGSRWSCRCLPGRAPAHEGPARSSGHA